MLNFREIYEFFFVGKFSIYTIGTGENLDTFNTEKYGEFLTYRNTVTVAEEQCQIYCDTRGTFWLKSLKGRTLLNGKLVRDSPVELKFGDVFYFSDIFGTWFESLVFRLAKRWNYWNTKIYRKFSWFPKEYPVFKFEVS
ncbi:hypothetical protein Fcan01_17764 [Folsomia candida]|uniref:FHA domain-containing protein n=1 Tax=Folsomia candida TaxID=158441 RepID=A0A226DSH4_FOLCA|nr:hypothetical protein Fcan01_17764 [Folsomia candida]